MGPSSAAGLVGSYSAGDTIAVVADSYWKAEKALAALDIEWNTNGKEQSRVLLSSSSLIVTSRLVWIVQTMSLWETLMQL